MKSALQPLPYSAMVESATVFSLRDIKEIISFSSVYIISEYDARSVSIRIFL